MRAERTNHSEVRTATSRVRDDGAVDRNGTLILGYTPAKLETLISMGFKHNETNYSVYVHRRRGGATYGCPSDGWITQKL